MTDHTDAEVEALTQLIWGCSFDDLVAGHGEARATCARVGDYIAAREAAARADERERVAAAIEAEAERAHAAFASDEDDHLADMRNRLGVELEPGHWNRHDDGCGMCGMSSAARLARSGVES